ncbi:unnamed protein product [Rotaria sp. Silwood2]|nr:unnamed protein product [Rotaria sp. Silwood2]CAF4009311.1 unnamed protein product [Rotaria sp. Silwood2]
MVAEMEAIRTIPELESKTAGAYYRTVENIRRYMQQLQKEAQKFLAAVDSQSENTNYRYLAKSLSRLKNVKWIDRITPGAHDLLMRRIGEELMQYADQLKDRLMKLDLSLKCHENVTVAEEILEKIESLSILESSIPDLEKSRLRLFKYFLKSTEGAFDCIQRTFSLQDSTVYQIKQELKELEQIKRDYENLHPAHVYLRKQEPSDIDSLNREIESLKNKQKTELVNQIRPAGFSHSLNQLETIQKKHDSLLAPRISVSSEEINFLKKKGFNSFESLYANIQEKKRIIAEREKNKQPYNFSGRLDASIANSALLYLLDKKIKVQLETFIDDIDKILSDIIMRELNAIEALINTDSFSEAEQGMKNLGLVQRELAAYCTSTAVTEKSQMLRERLDGIVNEILQRDFEDISKYSMNSPKDLIAKLKMVALRGNARFNQACNIMLGKIRQNFSAAVDQVRAASLEERARVFDQNKDNEPDLEALITQTKALVATVTQKPNTIIWDHSFRDKIPELLAYIFAVWTLKNTQHYNALRGIESARAYLLMPHVAQVLAIFRILGIGYKKYAKIKESKKSLTGKISDDLINNLVEIRTGEGKSVVMAVTACVFALIGVDVNCSCYSEVLSARDKNDFASVFRALGVEERIEYGTFNKLCENLLNERCNVREKVCDMIVNNKSAISIVGTIAYLRHKVLLIDEVDVFLSDKFYGGMYTPSVYLRDPSIKNLLDSIWQNKTVRNLGSIKATSAYQTCATRFSNWTFLLDEAIKDMISALQSFQSSTHIVQNDKIVYVEGESIVDNVVRGYDTVWTYYQENENGNISQSSLEANVGILVNCGTFSYAEMPHEFAYITGVTGTLRTLVRTETDILKYVYNVQKNTFMPSVFGRSNRIYNPNNDVQVMSESEYFMRIRGEIDGVCNADRAILIFFESEEKLMKFYESSELLSKKNDVQIITETVSVKERELYIKRAAMIGRITLLTRTFGRGTDFICRNQQLLLNGGMHVLQTFFSEELSEEYQIIGRGARQGDYGSYRMILLDKDLEWVLGSTWKEELPKISGTTLYMTLNEARNALYESKCAAKELGIEQCKHEHKASKEFMTALSEGNIKTVKKFLLEQNRGASLVTKTSRTVLLMDATGSMSNLLSAAKETVCTMFERASDILKEQMLPSDAFQMQIAIYRNYNSKENKILQASSWETKASHLRAFMNTISSEGGWGHEAIEIGLWHAVKESEMQNSISQVILIGDAPANTQKEISQKRGSFGEVYWEKTRFSKPTYYQYELEKLKEKNIPVHAFYLTGYATDDFQKIARQTQGRCEHLDIHSSDGAESLTDFVTEEILRSAAGDQGDDAVELYRTKYVRKTYMF